MPAVAPERGLSNRVRAQVCRSVVCFGSLEECVGHKSASGAQFGEVDKLRGEAEQISTARCRPKIWPRARPPGSRRTAAAASAIAAPRRIRSASDCQHLHKPAASLSEPPSKHESSDVSISPTLTRRLAQTAASETGALARQHQGLLIREIGRVDADVRVVAQQRPLGFGNRDQPAVAARA